MVDIVFVGKRTQCTVNELGAVVREEDLGGSPSANHDFKEGVSYLDPVADLNRVHFIILVNESWITRTY